MWKKASFIVTVMLLLITLGVIMIASASSVHAQRLTGDPLYFIRKQGLWLVIGSIGCVAAAKVPYRIWRASAIPLALLAILLLVITLIPGIGVRKNGSYRWLSLGFLRFQPSEMAKLSVILLFAWYYEPMRRSTKFFKKGAVVPLVLLAPFLGLIFLEPDFGTTIVVGAVGLFIMFIAGVRIGYLAIFGVIGVAGMSFKIFEDPERMSRILAYLNPEKYAHGDGHHLLQSLYSFVEGGWHGVGLGDSIQKQLWLPEAHTDFIFAIIAEELGLPFSGGVVVAFLAFFFCGMSIAKTAPDRFARLTAAGITMLIVTQAVINMGVVTGVLPTKGLALPFISYGGTSLLMSMILVGILVNIALSSEPSEDLRKAKPVKDQRQRV